jgi:hypothetical protein
MAKRRDKTVFSKEDILLRLEQRLRVWYEIKGRADTGTTDRAIEMRVKAGGAIEALQVEYFEYAGQFYECGQAKTFTDGDITPLAFPFKEGDR